MAERRIDEPVGGWVKVWMSLLINTLKTDGWKKKKKLNSMALVRKRTIPTEGPPLVGEVSANLCG
jgi:hypothetical protein